MLGSKPLQTVVVFFALCSAAVAQVPPTTGAVPLDANGAPLFNVNTRAPNTDEIPALSNMVKSGAKLYYMGERSGMHGWFIMKNGQIQMVYLSPDKQSVLIGGLFSARGENVTTPQISMLSERNEDIKKILTGTAQQQQEIMKAGEQDGAGSVAAGSNNASAKKEADAIPSVPVSPGERLIQDLKSAAGVTLGQNEEAELMMIAAPGCPNCKKTWQELREYVKTNKVQVRLIPVYNSVGGEESRVAAQLLKVANPLEAWDRFVEGDVTALAGDPGEMAIKAVVANLNLVTKWNIQGYPYLVYRGKDGRIKIVQGKPERMAAVMMDVTR
ncbi:MAG TPA: hypothetical protein DCY07_07345 [Rhodospirillaceae bacterium]|nr:hypothetical protein [Rhodospirillaceae bacterium]